MDKKEAIRKAAAKIIAREGYFNTKMQTIADEVGIAVGTIYIYFGSKEEILDYIFTYEHSKKLELINKLSASKMPLRESLEKFIADHINRVKDDPNVAKVLIQESLTPLTIGRETIKASFEKLKNAMEQFILKGQQLGEINKEYDVSYITEIFFYSILSLTAVICNREDCMEIEDAKKQAVLYIVNGLNKNILTQY